MRGSTIITITTMYTAPAAARCISTGISGTATRIAIRTATRGCVADTGSGNQSSRRYFR